MQKNRHCYLLDQSLKPTLDQHANKDTILISLLPLVQVSDGNDPHTAVTDVTLLSEKQNSRELAEISALYQSA